MPNLWRYLQAGLRLLYRRPFVAVAIVATLPDGRLVLVRRRDTRQWGLPGGLIEWGDDIAQTARAELHQEAGLDLVRITRLVGVYSSPERDPRVHAVAIAVAAEATGDPHVHDRGEIAEVRVFGEGEVPRGSLSHDHDRILADYLSGRTAVQ